MQISRSNTLMEEKMVSSLELKCRYVFSDVNWSLKGLCKQYLLNMLKKIIMWNWTRHSDRIWKHTPSPWACSCAHTRWFYQSVHLLHPTQAQVQYKIAGKVTESSAPPFYPSQTLSYKYPNQRFAPMFGCMWGPGWVQLMNWLTRRIWEPSASKLGRVTFPLLLECQCISVRGWRLMLCNCGTDSWPWLQISSPLPQISDTPWCKNYLMHVQWKNSGIIWFNHPPTRLNPVCRPYTSYCM